MLRQSSRTTPVAGIQLGASLKYDLVHLGRNSLRYGAFKMRGGHQLKLPPFAVIGAPKLKTMKE